MKNRASTGGRYHRDPDSGELTLAGREQPAHEEAGSPLHFMPLDTDTPTAPDSKAPARPQKRK